MANFHWQSAQTTDRAGLRGVTHGYGYDLAITQKPVKNRDMDAYQRPAVPSERRKSSRFMGLTPLGFVADGEKITLRNSAFRDRLRSVRKDIRSRYAERLAGAGFFHRLALYWRMTFEYRRERRRLLPSPGSLYVW